MNDALCLSFEWIMPDVLISELRSLSPQHLGQSAIRIVELPGHQVLEVVRLAGIFPRPSRNDLFALALAKWMTCTLLTGDAALREAAENEGVDCHGTLWVLDQIVNEDIITGPTAADALDRMTNLGSRFPRHEVRSRLNRWRKVL